MTLKKFKLTIILWLITAGVLISAVNAQPIRTITVDYSALPGNNYDKAEFRLWYADDSGPLRGAIILLTGSNGDGREMVEDSVWQAFAIRHNLALVGCYYTDKPHEQEFIEEYANASQGSGQALLDALSSFAKQSGHAELANAPLLLWGMSAGGEFNYEFVAWQPERIIAFVVNKGGIYYSALLAKAARNVPGMLFIGGKDIEFRNNTIIGLFAVNRRAGALWALAEEPNAEHKVGRSLEMSLIFFAEAMSLRLPADARSPVLLPLRTIDEKSGYLGDLKTGLFTEIGNNEIPNYPTAWLPTERVAKAWQALVTAQPL